MRPLRHVCAVALMWRTLRYTETCQPLGIDASGVSQDVGHVAKDYLGILSSDGVFWAMARRCLLLTSSGLF